MLLHGRMSVDERRRTLSSPATDEAILLATRAAIFDHFSLADVTDVVLYDIPANKIGLERLFDRFSKKAQLTVHVLVPSNVSEGPIYESLRIVRDTTGSEQNPLRSLLSLEEAVKPESAKNSVGYLSARPSNPT